MPDAHEVFHRFTDALLHLDAGVEHCLALFADDAVFEFPYAPALGLPPRHEGRAQIRGLLALIRARIPPTAVGQVTIHDMKAANELFIEYHSEGRIAESGQAYHQDYATFFAVEDGRIKVVREYFNAIASARAILPDGLASLAAR